MQISKRTKIVVTGGAGFIGTNTCLYLQKKYPRHEVVSFDIAQPMYPVPGVTYVHGDILSMIHLRRLLSEASKVFHLAAEIGTHETFLNPDVVNNVNIQGTLNVLECARDFEFLLFVASKPNIWLNPYSISKEAAEKYALMYHRVYGVKVAIIRWFSVYGPRQYIAKFKKAVPAFIRCALNNQPLQIYGDGAQEADFVFVDDVIAAADAAIDNGLFGMIMEFGLCRGVKVLDLANKIIQLTRSTSTIEHVQMRTGEDIHSKIFADHTKMPVLLGIPISLEKGIEKTIAFFREHDNAFY